MRNDMHGVSRAFSATPESFLCAYAISNTATHDEM